jgi:hypothetical protein
MDTANHIPTQFAQAGAESGAAWQDMRLHVASTLTPSLAERNAP